MTRYQDGGEALMEALRALDVDHIFCSPGSEWAPVWEAVTRNQVENTPSPAYHDLWHETLAVGMATGYTLVSGKMQAVLLHAGAGLLQGTCGIHGALLTEVPMLVMSSESNSYGDRETVDPGSQWYRNLSIVGGPHGLVDKITKWSCQVPGIETFYEFTKRAGEIAQRDPQGPVYLNVPVEVLLEPWQKPENAKAVVPPGRKVAPEEDVRALVDAIAAAERPIVITESTGRTRGGLPALVEFAEAFNIGIYEPQSVVSCNFPKAHPCYQGGNIEAERAKTDLILLVNCRSPWYPPSNTFPNAKVIVIDEAPQRPQMVYQVLHADRYVEGDVPATLRTAAAMAPKGVGEAHQASLAEGHKVLEDGWRKAEDKAAQNDRIEPVQLCRALREALPEGTIILDETITHSGLVRTHVRPEAEGSYSYVQGGLGQGIGVALGAKLAAPESFVLWTVGDGTFLYNPVVQGLAAAKAKSLPVLIVIFNNRQYLSMKFNTLRFYPDGQSVEHDAFQGVELSDQPELHELGAPLGAKGILVTEKAALHEALADAIATVQGGQTAILNVALTR